MPALRSSRLFEEEHFLKKNITNREYSKILINFTGFHLDNLEMINLINKCEALKSEKIHLFIRPHKASKKEIFKKLLSKKINYNFSEKDFYDEMKDTDILISRPNTACFESLIFGVPVLITRRKRSFLPAKTSKAFPSNLWFFTNDSNDLEKNINRIIGDKTKYIVQNVEERKKLLTEYFSPINKENIINLLR